MRSKIRSKSCGAGRPARPRHRALRGERLETRRLLAGPYAPAAGQVGSTAIEKDSPLLVAWAAEVASYIAGGDVDPVFQSPSQALGPAEGTTADAVSLGRGGQITLTFDVPIANGSGPDFAVFENAFNDTFLELGFVEVSSDGVNYFRFENDSATPSAVAAYGEVDPTQIHNLAGKYRQGFGTPFDLAELSGVSPLLDISRVTHVRLLDIVGDGTSADSSGDPIYDPFPTTGSAGLDVDGVGVIHEAGPLRDIVGLEDVGATLAAGSAFSGPDPDGASVTGPFGDSVVVGGFESETLGFNNAHSIDFGSWNQWAYANATDTTTAGFTNQFSSYAGGGAGGSSTFAVGFADQTNFFDPPTISRDPTDNRRFESLMVTNTTYAALSMLNGDSFAKKFGGVSGDDPDYFLLTIDGTDAGGNVIGTVEFYLADFRPADNSLDYIVDQWTQVDLSAIAQARSLEFTVSSSDNGPLGINTPAFFAIDDIALVTPTLAIEIEDDAVAESAGPNATTVRISRPDDDTTESINVTLTPVDRDLATVPTSVTIPAGQRFVEFVVGVSDNDVVDGDRQVRIEAVASGFDFSRRTLTIRDDESLALDLSPSQASLAEGTPLLLTVARNDADPSSPLTVDLSVEPQSADSSLVSVPTSVTIPSGETNVSFSIVAVEDMIDREPISVSVTAMAAGYIESSISVELLDNDLPTVWIETDAVAYPESAAAKASRLEDVGARLLSESFDNGADGSSGFESEGLLYNNEFDPTFGSWSGWSYSNTTDTTTPGFTNQYSAIPGAGAAGSDTYAVGAAYSDLLPTIRRAAGQAGRFQSIAITNTTYAALSMREGDEFAKKFGGASGDDPDFFLLTIEGFDASEMSTGTVEFYLADYRAADNSMDYIVDDWETVDISSLSDAVELKFSLTSSDNGVFGMNTPAYFAVDNVRLASSTAGPTAIVGRNTVDVAADLQVTLRSNDATEVTLPETVIIPAGETSVEVPIAIINDALVDGSQIVSLTAAAPSYQSSATQVTIVDDDARTLSLTITPPTLDEPGGEARAVLHRNVFDTSQPLDVMLAANLDQQLLLPPTVTIPAMARSVEFGFAAIDNDQVDGDRDVVVRATADGFAPAADSVVVLNDDLPPPVLELEFDRNTLSESDAPPTAMLEDVGAALPEQSFYNGADLASGFRSGTVRFNNTFDALFGSWGGWSVSNTTDNSTAGFANQYSAITGGGFGGSRTYAVASAFPGGTVPTITIDDAGGGLTFRSIAVTNTTYAALSMADGDAFAKKFGGESGDDPDYFRLTIEGFDEDLESVGSLDFYLADFRFADNAQDFIVDRWTTIDVSSLGATQLAFSVSSTDVGQFGINTPAYFAVDQVVLAGGEPASAVATVTRSDEDLSQPLIASIEASDAGQLIVPATVEIPAGQSSATFSILAADDAVADGVTPVQITVSEATHVSATAEITVEDNEQHRLTLTLSPDAVTESAGDAAAQLVIHRNSADLSVALPVALAVGSELQVPQEVTIPLGAAAVTVDVAVVDNVALDGNRTAEITASAEAIDSGRAGLTIEDDEVAALIVVESDGATVVDEVLISDQLSISLAAMPGSDVVVEIEGGGQDLVVDPARLVFRPGEWDQPQTVSVHGVPDLILEGDESIAITVRVDAGSSDARFAAAQETVMQATVMDHQPGAMRLDEQNGVAVLVEIATGVEILRSSDQGIHIVGNALTQSIRVGPLDQVTGPIEIEFAGGDDEATVLGNRFTRLDGGEGYDGLILATGAAIDLVDFLIGRVVGFEEIANAGGTELIIDGSALESLSADLVPLIRVGPDESISLLGDAIHGQPLMIGDDFVQVVQLGGVELRLISNRQWQNLLDHFDVNQSGAVTSLDALAVVNQLARVSESRLPRIESLEDFGGVYFDVSGDGHITALDALRVINEVARRRLVGESEELFVTMRPRASVATQSRLIPDAASVAQSRQPIVTSNGLRDRAIGQMYALDAAGKDEQCDDESSTLGWQLRLRGVEHAWIDSPLARQRDFLT